VPDIAAARAAVCTAAHEIAGASFAVLLEAKGAGLVETASFGLGLDPELEVSVGEEPSGAAAAFVSRQPYFVDDVRIQEAVAPRVVEAAGVV
jgi:hypothetical protein